MGGIITQSRTGTPESRRRLFGLSYFPLYPPPLLVLQSLPVSMLHATCGPPLSFPWPSRLWELQKRKKSPTIAIT